MAISGKAVSRLSQYRAALHRYKKYGTRKIFSCDIADTLGITAAQVRKDFAAFKFPGKKKVGYEVDLLIRNIDRLLLKNNPPSVVLCGCGPAMALLALYGANTAAFSIIAAFDAGNPPAVLDKSSVAFPVLPLDELPRFVPGAGVSLGIIAAPDDMAQRLLDMLVLAGIRGILNVSNAELKCPGYCTVTSAGILKEFEKLIYLVNNPPGGEGTRMPCSDRA